MRDRQTRAANGKVFNTEGFSCPINARRRCRGCGLSLGTKAYRVRKLAGLFCAIACIETEIFGGPHCRWCGERMEKSYTSIESPLCSVGCAASYRAHVLEDGTAMLGSGKRLRLWLMRNAPVQVELEGRRCANPRCRKDEGKYPATIDHLRAGTLFCSASCKMQFQRSPNRHFSPSKRAVFIEDSSNDLPSKAFGINPGDSALQNAPTVVSS
jgi:hypothetical protein